MKKTISILLSACIALTSCESFLDREPVAEVGSGDYFKDETSLLTYTNGFLQTAIRTSWPRNSRSPS